MKTETPPGISCAAYIIVIILNMVVGGWAINYILFNLFQTSVPTWAASIAGLFIAEPAVIGALIVWLLKLAGVV